LETVYNVSTIQSLLDFYILKFVLDFNTKCKWEKFFLY
jgi:hypothetical protein